jgi:hypothetical protein
MSNAVAVIVNGKQVAVPAGSTVAVAMMIADASCRRSVSGEARGPLCGMGVCYECCVIIDGTPHCRSCQVFCEAGMEVNTEN